MEENNVVFQPDFDSPPSTPADAFETDYMSEFLDNIFKFPCDNCKDRAECNFEGRSKCCEKRIGTILQAERIA